MKITDRLEDLLAQHPKQHSDSKELARLQEFFERMKKAGVAKTREYDLPPPDTLGRSLTPPKKRAI